MTTTAIDSKTKFDRSHLLKASGIAAGGSIVGNLIVFFIGGALGASFLLPEQGPIPAMMVIIASLVGVVGGLGFYTLLDRFTENTTKIFDKVALVLLVLTFISPITSGADTGTIVALSVMHFVSGAFVIWFIPKR